MNVLSDILRGDRLFARATRSSAWTIFGQVAAQAVRLVTNLILTRLLFPEAFGMMTLVTVILVGLVLFSDAGISPAIMQNRRGDDPDFLNTAWTIQAVRGGGLWLVACALARPAAIFYDAPMLEGLLPVAGFSLLISGFNPMKLETANRHLAVGPVIQTDLIAQAVSVLAMVVLAWMTHSVWALAIGANVGAITKLAAAHVLLPGGRNTFLWERGAVRELVAFGKWIFLSTAFGFLVGQGDKLILGKYLSLDSLGIYNIGYFLASFPIYLGFAVVSRIMIPIYREKNPAHAPDNYRKIRIMRLVMTGFLLSALLGMAFLGVTLVDILYDSRYVAAGAIVVIVACAHIPLVIGMTYDQAALAAGDSRYFSYLVFVKAAVLITFMLIGVEAAGVVGALAGQALALILVYPMVIWLARRHGAWDPLHDGVYALVGVVFAVLALWVNRTAIAALAAINLT
jgi:O-antigen/teichoic acid export membrane protein